MNRIKGLLKLRNIYRFSSEKVNIPVKNDYLIFNYDIETLRKLPPWLNFLEPSVQKGEIIINNFMYLTNFPVWAVLLIGAFSFRMIILPLIISS